MSVDLRGDGDRVGLFRANQSRHETDPHPDYWDRWPDILKAYRRYRSLGVARPHANLLTIGYAAGLHPDGPVIATMTWPDILKAYGLRNSNETAGPPAPAGPTGWWDPPAAWAGSTLDEYVFHLIGAVSTVMLPPSHVMPSEAVQAIKVAVDASGPPLRATKAGELRSEVYACQSEPDPNRGDE